MRISRRRRLRRIGHLIVWTRALAITFVSHEQDEEILCLSRKPMGTLRIDNKAD